MYSAIIINVLNQMGQFSCTILCTDMMGVMPEWRIEKTYDSSIVNTTFIASELSNATAQAMTDYLASQGSGD